MGIFFVTCALLYHAFAPSQPTAKEQFASLRQQAHAASQAGNTSLHLEAILKIVELLNHAPGAVESAAWHTRRMETFRRLSLLSTNSPTWARRMMICSGANPKDSPLSRSFRSTDP